MPPTLKTVKLSPTVLTAPNRASSSRRRIGGDAEHLDVGVFRREPEQPIPYPAADDEGAAAGCGGCAGDVRDHLRHVRGHCSRRLPYLRTRPSAKPGATALMTVSARDFLCGYTSATGCRMQRSTAAATVSALCFGPSPLTEWP